MTSVTTAPVGSKSTPPAVSSRSCARKRKGGRSMRCYRQYYVRRYFPHVVHKTKRSCFSFVFARDADARAHPELGDRAGERGRGSRRELDVVGDGSRQLHGNHVRVPGVRRGGCHDVRAVRPVGRRRRRDARPMNSAGAPGGGGAHGLGLGGTETLGVQQGVRLVAVHGVLARVRSRRVDVASGLSRRPGAPCVLRGGARGDAEAREARGARVSRTRDEAGSRG